MEGRAFLLKKIVSLCVACLLLLSGCLGGGDPETPSPTPPSAVTPTPTPLSVETPVVPSPSPTLTETVEPDAPAESPPDEAPPPVPTETAAVAEGWNGDPDSLALNDFPTQLSSGDEVMGSFPLEDYRLFLISQLPDYDTWLYGAYGPDMEGLILRVGIQWKYFDIPHLTPRALMPDMAYGDFDGDLDMELAIMPYQASGTEVSIWGLSVVDFGADGVWRSLAFSPKDYQAILEQSITCTYHAESNLATFRAGESVLELDLTALGYPAPGEPVTAGGGSIVSFGVDGDNLYGSFTIGLSAPNIPAGALVNAVTLSADVVYTGSAFGLNELYLSPAES